MVGLVLLQLLGLLLKRSLLVQSLVGSELGSVLELLQPDISFLCPHIVSPNLQ
jgi:hypothetical protein